MRISTKFISGFLACCLLQGCAADSMNKQGAGTLLGGVAGGLVGSRFGKGEGALLATGAGAIIGALIGGQVGKSLDDKDRQIAELTSQRALESAPTGKTSEWHNPDSGNYGSVTPNRTFRSSQGQYCREYTHTIVVGGQQEEAYGKACRQPDGHWKIMN